MGWFFEACLRLMLFSLSKISAKYSRYCFVRIRSRANLKAARLVFNIALSTYFGTQNSVRFLCLGLLISQWAAIEMGYWFYFIVNCFIVAYGSHL